MTKHTRKLFSYLLVSVLFFFSACSDEYMDDVVEPIPLKNQTRALSFDLDSKTNKTLHSNWENVTKINLNNGSVAYAPWVYMEGNSMNIPYSYRIDIKKKDGWEMLSHTMLDYNSTEPNYMIFYNAKRGLLKVFYFNPSHVDSSGLIWWIEADSPTGILPSNKGIQYPFDLNSRFMTSSNIVKESNFNFGQLNQGWNMALFELIYSPVNNAPMISIGASNYKSISIDLTGKYSGEVIIPEVIERDSPENRGDILNIIGGLAKGLSKVVSKNSVLSKILSTGGTAIGSMSAHKTISDTVYVHAQSSGNMELHGKVDLPSGGIVTTTNDVDIKRINNGRNLGLWTLSEEVEFEYYSWQELQQYSNSEMSSAYIPTPAKGDLKSYILINPEVLNELAGYNVVDYQFFSSTKQKPLVNEVQLTDNCYSYHPYMQFVVPGVIPPLEEYHGKALWMVKSNCKMPDDLYVNLTVEFSYKDGSTFISSRNFKPKLTAVNNGDFYQDLMKDSWNYVVVY